MSNSPEETAAIASALAPLLRAGDVLLLEGDLAAGKTFFAAALARALGSEDAVTSPTFAIAQFYRGRAGPILHIDAYRLESLAEFRNLALDDYFATAIVLIEWGDKVAVVFRQHLSVAFATEGDTRTLRFAGAGQRWSDAMAEIARAVEAA